MADPYGVSCAAPPSPLPRRIALLRVPPRPLHLISQRHRPSLTFPSPPQPPPPSPSPSLNCPNPGRYTNTSSIYGRFSALTFHTFSDGEPLHYPNGGRLLMRCSHTPVVGAKGGGGGSRTTEMPTRYIKTATISNGASSGDAPGMPKRPPETPRERKAALQTQGGGGLEQRFSLYIDGELYGPFAHVVLTPCVPPGEAEAITLPVQTFFPLETPVG